MTAWRTSAVLAALLCVALTATANAKPHKKKHHRVYYSQSQNVIGGRPAGCPSRFCGCALSIRIFGAIKPRFNLAANWFSFPRTRPAPDMVAVRRGHVFQLLSPVAGSTWTVWDPNSGGGRIRIHQRSIAGYAIVDPRGSRMASN